jgi:hypothetical protein
LQRANVIFVTVSCHTANNAVFSLEQPTEIRNDYVYIVTVFGFWKHQTAINQQDLFVLLDRHAVSPDFAEPA